MISTLLITGWTNTNFTCYNQFQQVHLLRHSIVSHRRNLFNWIYGFGIWYDSIPQVNLILCDGLYAYPPRSVEWCHFQLNSCQIWIDKIKVVFIEIHMTILALSGIFVELIQCSLTLSFSKFCFSHLIVINTVSSRVAALRQLRENVLEW